MNETTELTHLPLSPEHLANPAYLPVDAIPELASARLIARRDAYEIVEQNRQHLRDGDFKAVSIPVDALGTARRVTLNRHIYGEDSSQARESFEGLILDSERLLGEAARKNTYEYFRPTKQTRDTQSGDYLSHGQSISVMTEKGLTPVAEAEELERRINEYVEEATYKAIGGMVIDESVTVRTISECTDWAIEAHRRNSKGGHGGYVPEIEKFMVRDVKFDPITHDRYEEQLGLSGIFINHEVITETLRRHNIQKENISKTEVHSTQMLADNDLVDFVAELDEVASEVHGLDIFLGEVLTEGQTKDYNHVRQEAEGRRQNLAPKPKKLAEFIMGLELENTDEWVALGLVEARVKEMLFDIAGEDYSAASIIFDQQTAAGLQEVAYLRSNGLMEEAQTLLADVKTQAPAPGYCGAGSCGLESINQNSNEAKKMKELGLDSKDALRDTERHCRGCGKKEVVYDLKSNKKACLACNATAKF